MTLKARLFASFGLMIALIAGACATALMIGSSLGRSVTQMIDIGTATDSEASNVESALARAELGVSQFITKPAPDGAGRIRTALQDASKHLESLAALASSPDLKQNAQQAAQLREQASAGFEALNSLLVKRGFSENEGAQGELRAAAHDIEKAVQDQGLAELTVILLMCRRHEKDYLLRGDPKYVASIGERIKEFETQLGQFGLPVETQKTTMALWTKYHDGMNKVVACDAQVAAKRAEFAASVARLHELTDAISSAAQKDIARERADVAAGLTNQRSLLLGMLGIAVLIGAAVAFLTTRSITGPLSILVAQMARAAKGDLTVQANLTRRDEIGTLAGAFDGLISGVRSMIADVASAAGEVRGGAVAIAQCSQEAAKGMDLQSARVTEISAAVEQMSASVAEVAQKAGGAAESASEAGTLAADGGNLVQQTISDMGRIDQSVSQGAEMVTELGKSSEQIGTIVATINDIADQTNLLALNAAIEAARAGEHGRGFAVVADEVRKLADRTTTATAEVARSIASIREQTARTVDQMKAGAACVRQSVERANTAGSSLEKIVGSAGSVADMVRSIAAGTAQQSSASEEISRTLVEVSSFTREASSSIGASSATAAQLSDQSDRLNQLVGKFIVK